MFKEAYDSTIKVSTITNAFKRSGTYPCNKDAIDPRKLAPSVSSYKESTTVSVPVNVPIEPILQIPVEYAPDIPSAEECKVTADSSELALKALESQMEPEILTKFKRRLEEGYDLKDDVLYTTWVKLKLVKGTNLQQPPLANITNTYTICM